LSPHIRTDLSSFTTCTHNKYNHSRLYEQSLNLNSYGPNPRVMMAGEHREDKERECFVWFCRRFETGGSLGRRVNVAACPSPDGSARGRARRGEVRWPEMGVRELEIPRPSCSSRAQVGCACSRGLQASTRERERAASRERLTRPRPRATNPL
jgi:hypothetical protein